MGTQAAPHVCEAGSRQQRVNNRVMLGVWRRRRHDCMHGAAQRIGMGVPTEMGLGEPTA
jgi:hypothetical protein